MHLLDCPINHIAEIAVFSTGGGYGESCVVHLGNQKWMVIDSCKDPKTGLVLPLDYLNEIGVNIEKDLVMIVCTHWHDDHIRGISEILSIAKSSEFCFARATDLRKFLTIVKMDYVKAPNDPTISSTIEFNKCLHICESRGSQIKYAQSDRTLLNFNIDKLHTEVISLSPSDLTSEEFDKELSTLFISCKNNIKIETKTPNDRSIVLYFKFNNVSALLGADLGVSDNKKAGWYNILNYCVTRDSKSSFYKVAHHGSRNSHHIRIWDELLDKNPIACLTPWNRKTKLPENEMLKELCKLSTDIYMTIPNPNDKPKKRERQVEKLINDLNKSVKEAKYERGMIRFRIDMTDPNPTWEIALLENAVHVNALNL